MNKEKKILKLKKRILKLKRFKKWADARIRDAESELMLLSAGLD